MKIRCSRSTGAVECCEVKSPRRITMKKFFFIISSFCLFGFASPSFASSGLGCGVWGPVSYVYIGNSTTGTSTILAIINGYACFVTGATSNLTPQVAILSDAIANGKTGYLTDTTAAINP
jgi:hypothetical protein